MLRAAAKHLPFSHSAPRVVATLQLVALPHRSKTITSLTVLDKYKTMDQLTFHNKCSILVSAIRPLTYIVRCRQFSSRSTV